jgi:chromosome segregation protein
MKARKALEGLTWKQVSQKSGIPLQIIGGLVDGQSIPLNSALQACSYLGLSEQESTFILSSVKAKNHNLVTHIPAHWSSELARFMGYVISEGRVIDGEVFFYNDEECLRNDFAKCCTDCFGLVPTECTSGKKRFLILPSKAVTVFLEEILGLKPFTHSRNKRIPDSLFGQSQQVVAAFLSSLYDGDGSVSNASGKLVVDYTSASPELARGLCLLLLRFGVHARLSSSLKAATNTKSKTKREYYRVIVSGKYECQRLPDALSFSLLKLPRLTTALSVASIIRQRSSAELVPNCTGLVREALKSSGYTHRRLKLVTPSRIRAYFEGRATATREGLEAVAALVGPGYQQRMLQLAKSQVCWDPIVSINEVVGEQWVYDLCVQGNHNFLADGIYVHNSNTIDGLLFAFGDSSLKAMRVKKTVDLIHQDNKVAQVTVTLEAADGTKHEVSRMVKRDGMTKYLLDGKRVKKFAITNFLSHHSLNMSNIIKQGEVQRIVEMNSKDRRALLDQAANVAEYEEKKREAFSELEAVDSKLKEASTVLAEREGYLLELERERDAALKFKDLSAQRDSVKATLISVDTASLEEEFTTVVNSKLDIDNKMSTVEKRIVELGEEINRKNTEKDVINKEILARGSGAEAQLQREIDGLVLMLEAAKKSVEEKQAQSATLLERKREKALEHQRTADEVTGAAKQLVAVRKEVQALRQMVSEKSAEYEQMLSKSNAFSSEFHTARALVEKTRDDMLNVKEKLSTLQAEVSKDEELVRMKEREHERLKEGAGTDFAPKLQELNARIKSCRNTLSNAQSELDALFTRERELNASLPALEDELLHAREKAAEIGSKLRTADAAVVSRALEAVLELKEKLPGVHGTIEELCTYSSKFAVPVQVGLGPRSQFVVVDSVKVASKAIAVIKERKLGRVSFIPLDKINYAGISANDRKVAESSGSFGFLIDHLEFDKRFSKAFEFACGNTVIAQDIKSSEALVGKIRIATMEGELAEQSGLLSGGSFTPKVNLAAEKRQLDEWTARAKSAAEDKETVMTQLSQVREESTESRKRKAEAELALKSAEIELSHLKGEQEEEKRKRSDVTSALAQVEQEVSTLRSNIETSNTERSKLIRALSELNTTALEARQKMDLEKEANFGMQLKEKERNLSELRVKLADYESQEKSLVTQSNVYERAAAALEKESREAAEESKALESSLKEIINSISEGKLSLKKKQEEQKKVSGAISELVNAREKLESAAAKLANEKGKLEFERERLQRTMSEGTVRKAVLETQLTQLKAQLAELAGAKVITGKTAADKPELTVTLKGLQASIEELGGVNLLAIELYSTRLKEFEDQKQKVTQLSTEKEAVISVINAVEGKKIATFMQVFNVVNENFRKVFSQIFPGDGHLFLENPEKPFDGGLTIEIKLTNKEVKYLELMSGGEKSLIALIFLFALQASNPSSVAILDEADAALDADNSRKLAELVKALSKDTQFLVVSHNQNLFKLAQTLVGVAMSDGGSRVVEVKLGGQTTAATAAPQQAKASK